MLVMPLTSHAATLGKNLRATIAVVNGVSLRTSEYGISSRDQWKKSATFWLRVFFAEPIPSTQGAKACAANPPHDATKTP